MEKMRLRTAALIGVEAMREGRILGKLPECQNRSGIKAAGQTQPVRKLGGSGDDSEKTP